LGSSNNADVPPDSKTMRSSWGDMDFSQSTMYLLCFREF
jgi:hypothetical protein